MFDVPTEVWRFYVPPDQRGHTVCLACWEELVEVTDSGEYQQAHGGPAPLWSPEWRARHGVSVEEPTPPWIEEMNQDYAPPSMFQRKRARRAWLSPSKPIPPPEPVQLELFTALPTVRRPPRRLRRIGFEVQLVRGDIGRLEEVRTKLDRYCAELAAAVAEARVFGHVIPDAYHVAVETDEIRDKLTWKLKDTHDLARQLEDQLARGIERLL
jgi:hypothetical protein